MNALAKTNVRDYYRIMNRLIAFTYGFTLVQAIRNARSVEGGVRFLMSKWSQIVIVWRNALIPLALRFERWNDNTIIFQQKTPPRAF